MYGPEHMMSLDNLERIGLLEDESSRMASQQATFPTKSFGSTQVRTTTAAGPSGVRHTIAAISAAYGGSLRRSLRLQVAAAAAPTSNGSPTTDGSSASPSACQSLDAVFSSLFGGAVPISVRLVQAMALGWPTRSMLAPTSATGGGAMLASAASSALQAGRRSV